MYEPDYRELQEERRYWAQRVIESVGGPMHETYQRCLESITREIAARDAIAARERGGE